MSQQNSKKSLGELISRVVGQENLRFNFNKWQSENQKEIQEFQAQAKHPGTEIPILKNIWGIIMKNPITQIAAAASFLIVLSWAVSFVLYREVADLRNELELARQDIVATPIKDSVTINFYLEEHQDFIARQAALNSAASQPVQIHIDYDNIMYYELLDDDPEFMSPGIIFRGPSFQNQTGSSDAPIISNGHTLTLSEAQENANFDLVAPPRLHPYYMLGQIRRIEGRDSLQLLYTDGINSVSLFEQPLDGQRGLEPKDFREYIIYRNQGKVGGIILAWRDNTLSYVLIGNIELSQLMDMAQSIIAGK